LEELAKKDVTYELLSRTKIGKTIRILATQSGTEEEDKKVQKLSKELMQRWKDMLKDTKQERKGQPQKEEKKEEPKEEVVKVSTRYLVGDDVRDTLRKKFIEILQTPVDTDKYDEETNEKAIDIAIKIEELLTSLHKDRKVYSDKARSLIFNLRDPKNPQLKKKVLEEEYQVLQFVTLSPKELANELKKQERDESIKQNLDARRSDWVKEQL